MPARLTWLIVDPTESLQLSSVPGIRPIQFRIGLGVENVMFGATTPIQNFYVFDTALPLLPNMFDQDDEGHRRAFR